MSRLAPLIVTLGGSLRPTNSLGGGNPDACSCSPWCVRLLDPGHAVAGRGARSCRFHSLRLQACGTTDPLVT